MPADGLGALESLQWTPLATRGAEFVLRTHAGPLPPWSLGVAESCRRHAVHGGLVNASVATDLPQFRHSASGGGSTLLGPDGQVMARAGDGGECTVSATLLIGEHRIGERRIGERRDTVEALPG